MSVGVGVGGHSRLFIFKPVKMNAAEAVGGSGRWGWFQQLLCPVMQVCVRACERARVEQPCSSSCSWEQKRNAPCSPEPFLLSLEL